MSPKVSEKHKEQRRLELLKAAKQVFIENGYEKTTMKHVMEQARVSRGGLYLYFSNKEDLFEAILDQGMDENISEIHEMIDSTKSCWLLLERLMKGEEDNVGEKTSPSNEGLAPVILEFFITGRNSEKRVNYALERHESARNIFRPIIVKGIDREEFSPLAETDVIINTLLSFSDGLAISSLVVKRQRLEPQKQVDVFLQYLHYILQVDETRADS